MMRRTIFFSLLSLAFACQMQSLYGFISIAEKWQSPDGKHVIYCLGDRHNIKSRNTPEQTELNTTINGKQQAHIIAAAQSIKKISDEDVVMIGEGHSIDDEQDDILTQEIKALHKNGVGPFY